MLCSSLKILEYLSPDTGWHMCNYSNLWPSVLHLSGTFLQLSVVTSEEFWLVFALLQELLTRQREPAWTTRTAGIWTRSKCRNRWSSSSRRAATTAQENSSTYCSARYRFSTHSLQVQQWFCWFHAYFFWFCTSYVCRRELCWLLFHFHPIELLIYSSVLFICVYIIWLQSSFLCVYNEQKVFYS